MRAVLQTLPFVLAGLLLAGIIHIVAVLAVPALAVGRPYERIAAVGPENVVVVLPDPVPGASVLPRPDPAMAMASCRFSLADRPFRLAVSNPSSYWAVALYTRSGANFYTITNRAIGRQGLDMRVLSTVQLARLRESPPADIDDMVLVEAPEEDVLALVRAFVANPAEAPLVKESFASIDCEPFSLPAPPPSERRRPGQPIPSPRPQ